LLSGLEGLTKDGVKVAVQDYLGSREIDPLMQRRDLLVAHFRRLIAEVGEEKVLY
jgi:hypothetical protein